MSAGFTEGWESAWPLISTALGLLAAIALVVAVAWLVMVLIASVAAFVIDRWRDGRGRKAGLR